MCFFISLYCATPAIFQNTNKLKIFKFITLYLLQEHFSNFLSCDSKNFEICTRVFLVIKLYTQKSESKWHDTNCFFMPNVNARCENFSYIVTREPSVE